MPNGQETHGDERGKLEARIAGRMALPMLPKDPKPEDLSAPLDSSPTPEELAKAMFEPPADYEWQYPKMTPQPSKAEV